MRSLILVAILAAASSHAAELTVQQAKTMPMRELAGKILGEAGSIIRDIDRPRSDALEPMRFYGRAISWGSFFGVCASDLVIVEFDKNGRVESLQSERRFGVEGDIYKRGWTYAEFADICFRAKSTRHYFPAPDHLSAWIVAKYVDAIAGKGAFAAQGFDYTCSGECADRKTDLSLLRLSDVESVKKIACKTTELKRPDCYQIDVRSESFPKEFEIHGTTEDNKVVIQRVSVHGGIILH